MTTRACSSCDNPIPTDATFCPVCGASAASPILGDTLLGASRFSGDLATSYELAPERLQAALGPNFVLGRLLGRGGYAEVFTVRDVRLKRELALKVLRPDLILTDALVSRFRREAEAVGALQNTHIVPVYDVGEADGILWLLMPLVQGETLKSVLAREHRLPVAEARRILLEAAEALQAAHEAGVVHRDIKPENLMIDGKTRRVLLMDFGIAKAMDPSLEHSLTGTGVVIGTPQYMSPEQAIGSGAPDARSDQYSLAVVGYQMLAGRVPFEGDNVREIMAKQLLEEAVPLSRILRDIPPEISATIHQALRKELKLRFASMDAFARSLRGELVTPSEGGKVVRKSKFNIPQRRRPWIAAGIWALVLGGGVYGASRAGLFTPAPAPAAPPAPPDSTAARRPDSGRRLTFPVRQGTPQRTAPTDSALTAMAPPPAPVTCEAAFVAAEWVLAFRYCTKEADTSTIAQRNLGLIYSEGYGVERNDRLAAVNLAAAAESGEDTIAVVEMAKRYDTGRGVAVDQVKATRFYHIAANLGVKLAFPIVARRYDEGIGIEKNPEQAARWYERAATAMDVPSMTRLAAAYDNGWGVKKDEAKATLWYTNAAQHQEPEAEYQLALRLLNGRGGFRKSEKERTAGMGWLRRAAEHGHDEARKELARRGG